MVCTSVVRAISPGHTDLPPAASRCTVCPVRLTWVRRSRQRQCQVSKRTGPSPSPPADDVDEPCSLPSSYLLAHIPTHPHTHTHYIQQQYVTMRSPLSMVASIKHKYSSRCLDYGSGHALPHRIVSGRSSNNYVPAGKQDVTAPLLLV